jgi:hypothetical protein
VTVSYPDYIRGVLDAAADLPGRSDLGYITWSGDTGWCKVLQEKDLWYFIPLSLWGFQEGEKETAIKTYSTLSIVQGIGGGTYHLINLPLITRKYLRARYKRTSKKSK